MELVTSQPMGFKVPMVAPHVSGLNRLDPLSEVMIRQLMPKCCEIFGCLEYNNQFAVTDIVNNRLFMAKEDSKCMMRCFCCNLREFTMPLYLAENENQEILRFERPLNCSGLCCNCCYPSCMQVLMVYSGPNYLGKIVEYPTWWNKKLEVWNSNEVKVFDVKGPCCIVQCGCHNLFHVKKGGTTVGIIKQFSREMPTDAITEINSFSIQFPSKTDVIEKALIIGATILMDMMYFERNYSK